MTSREPSIRIPVDPTNPGQFFACCGLLELADRLCGGAEGWFEQGSSFQVWSTLGRSLPDVLAEFKDAVLSGTAGDDNVEADEDNDAADEEHGGDNDDLKARPLTLYLGNGGALLLLDWWANKALKPWAGSMNARVIFRAMTNAVDPGNTDPLNDARVVYDPEDVTSKRKQQKKREPFYFDARRGLSARSLDIGFMPDALSMPSIAYPAVEALCLVGLQRFRPRLTGLSRVFEYHTWSVPLSPLLASLAVCGALPLADRTFFRFENAFRTPQRKHKAFTAAKAITERQP